MSAKTYFISGANRGIGFELVKRILETSPESTIIATTRDPSRSKELEKLSSSNPDQIKIVKLDVSSQDSISKLSEQIGKITKTIDIVIFNAAIADSYKKILETDTENFLNHYTTNVLGPIQLTKALYPFLTNSNFKQLIYISSIAGSLSGFFPVSTGAYGQSKAALNHTVLTLSNELKDEGFTVVAVHPGAVQSEMGNYGLPILAKKHPDIAEALLNGSITTEQSAKDQIELYSKLTKEDNGKFFSFDGSEIPY